MNWLVFTYSLPTQSRSSPRVAVWRRLRRLGAVTVAGGAQVLPDRDECLEAFQWLAQEIRKAKGEAQVMRVERFEGLTDQQLADLFCAARTEDYGEIGVQAAKLEGALKKAKSKDTSQARNELAKLRRQYADVARVDYFECSEGRRVASRLSAIEQLLSLPIAKGKDMPSVSIEGYRDKRWVTRPRPYVDRLACAWLIRRFINPEAVIRYSEQTEPDEVTFDMEQGQFGHQGHLCTFEAMRLAFGLDDPALRAIAEIVHEIDLQDERYTRPETIGVDAVLEGWWKSGLPDAELETRGITLFDALYSKLTPNSQRTSRKSKAV
jgi:hypothetical protein